MQRWMGKLWYGLRGFGLAGLLALSAGLPANSMAQEAPPSLLNPQGRDLHYDRHGPRPLMHGSPTHSLPSAVHPKRTTQTPSLSLAQQAALRAQGLDAPRPASPVYDARMMPEADLPDLRSFERNQLNTREQALYRDGAPDVPTPPAQRDFRHHHWREGYTHNPRYGAHRATTRYRQSLNTGK